MFCNFYKTVHQNIDITLNNNILQYHKNIEVDILNILKNKSLGLLDLDFHCLFAICDHCLKPFEWRMGMRTWDFFFLIFGGKEDSAFAGWFVIVGVPVPLEFSANSQILDTGIQNNRDCYIFQCMVVSGQPSWAEYWPLLMSSLV